MAHYKDRDFQIINKNLHKDWANLTVQFGSDSNKVLIEPLKTGADFLAENPSGSLPIGVLATDKVAKLTFTYSEDTSAASTYGTTTLIGMTAATGAAGQGVSVATTVTPSTTNMVVTVDGVAIAKSDFSYAAGTVTVTPAQTIGATIRIYHVPLYYLTSSLGTSKTDFTATATTDVNALRNLVFPMYMGDDWRDAVEARNWGRDNAAYLDAGSFGIGLSSNTSATTANMITAIRKIQNGKQGVGGGRQGYVRKGNTSYVFAPTLLSNTNPTTGTAAATAQTWAGTDISAITGTFSKTDVRSVHYAIKAFFPSVDTQPSLWLFAIQGGVIPKRRPALVITLDDCLASQYTYKDEFISRKIPVSHAVTYTNIVDAPAVAGLSAQATDPLSNYTAAQMVEMSTLTFTDLDGVTRNAIDFVVHGDHATNGWADYDLTKLQLEVATTRNWFSSQNLGTNGNNFVVYPQNCWESKLTSGEYILDSIQDLGLIIGRANFGNFFNEPLNQTISKATIAGLATINCASALTGDANLNNATDAATVVQLMNDTGLDVVLTYHGFVTSGAVNNDVLVSDLQAELDVFQAARNAGDIRIISAIEYGQELGYLSGGGSSGGSSGGLLPSLIGSIIS